VTCKSTKTTTQNVLLFPMQNGYAKAPQCYITPSLPIFFFCGTKSKLRPRPPHCWGSEITYISIHKIRRNPLNEWLACRISL